MFDSTRLTPNPFGFDRVLLVVVLGGQAPRRPPVDGLILLHMVLRGLPAAGHGTGVPHPHQGFKKKPSGPREYFALFPHFARLVGLFRTDVRHLL